MFFIIRNIFIIRNGVLLLDRNFGECQSFNGSFSLFSGFVSALETFTGEITKSALKSINFEDFKINFYRDLNKLDLLYVLITDLDDNYDQIQHKLKKISRLFLEKHQDILTNFDGNINQFNKFGDILIDMEIAQKNCGGHPECYECQNRNNNSKIFMAYKKDTIGFKNQINSLIEESTE